MFSKYEVYSAVQSMNFAVSIINLVKELKTKHETIISNQIGGSGTSNAVKKNL